MLDEIFVVEIAIFKSIAIPFQPPEIDIVTQVSTPLMEITLYIRIHNYIGQMLVLSHSTPQPSTVYIQCL